MAIYLQDARLYRGGRPLYEQAGEPPDRGRITNPRRQPLLGSGALDNDAGGIDVAHGRRSFPSADR